MPDIINLLPDNIANQIAAGEVIQRPASAVKELLENAVDAGASEVRLFISDAGKALVQVVDNGKGMSETDARMAFERHATSKIQSIDDLFRIRTMGFRGEALASIAAVAQVELKTKRKEDNHAMLLEIENSNVKRQEPVAAPDGTSIAMKNLFFNVPARRNFLKSNPSEMRHIVDEFIRVSMAFPEVFFSLSSNGQEIFHLEKGSLKQRLVQVLGNQYNAKLVSVQERTDYLDIYGFVGKPETSKKTRGDQYLFVNNRFIKSAYLNHAVMSAFQEMIPRDSFPMYALFIDLDPAQVDINVHPTKQEIKFEDEKIVYAFVQSAVKHALAQFSITPALDFELDPSIQNLGAVSRPASDTDRQTANNSSLFRSFSERHRAHFIEPKSDPGNWKDFFKPCADALSGAVPEQTGLHGTDLRREQPAEDCEPLVIHGDYIAVQNDFGYLLISLRNAHERILYERFSNAISGKAIATQQSLFPAVMQLSPADAVLLTDLIPDLHQLGYHLEDFGNHSFVIQGTPADVDQTNGAAVIESLLEQYKHFSSDLKFSKREKLMRSLASQQSLRNASALSRKELQLLIIELFACTVPNATPNGKPVYSAMKKTELDRMFGK